MELAEDELKNLAKTWILGVLSLCYCYLMGKITHRGPFRLLSIIPVIFLFLILPLNLTSVHFCGITSFFLSWLANFKLLLFAAGRGPLCSTSDPSPIPLPLFIAVACLPIKIHHHPPHDSKDHPSCPPPQIPRKSHPLNFIIKAALLPLLLKIYDYGHHLHPKVVWLLYCFHIYFSLELILATVAAAASVFHGVELEPQFKDPLLSTSLQDFWGRRWNLMVTSILRTTVYQPSLGFFSRYVRRRTAKLPSVFMTFVVSAAMHELVFYHMGRLRPNFQITFFFLLHGFCLCAEIAIKEFAGNGKLRLRRAVSGPLTVAFVVATGFWLFFPPFLRCGTDVRAFNEYAVLGAFLRNFSRALIGSV
ncbi:hypothetical protein Dimus_033028 [Dionaea muscipula]